MTSLPVLTISLGAYEDSKQSYKLGLALSGETRRDVLHVAPQRKSSTNSDSGIPFTLPFSLDLLPYIQLILDAIQSTKRPSPLPLQEHKKVEKELIKFGVLDTSGNIPTAQVLTQVGKMIGTPLLTIEKFQDYLQRFYDSSRETKGGDIVFTFDADVLKLAALPWELASDGNRPLLVHPNGGDILLSCSRVILDKHHTRRHERNQSLRVLEVASYAGMDGQARTLEQEKSRRLEEALRSIQEKEFDRSMRGEVSLEALELLLNKNLRADILDYYGHGSLDKNGCAMLSMYDENGAEVSIPTGKLLALSNLPPLLVFHVCHSAQIDVRYVECSLAPMLIKYESIEAIVAMQSEIQMRVVAQHIIPVLYEELVKHESLPQAVARVRQKLFTLGVDAKNWFVPVLYMREFSQAPFLPPKSFSISPNPFLAQRAIDDASFFVGRQNQVKEMWELLSYKMSLVITGKSGCGKTSMLKLILDEKNIQGKLSLHQPTKVVQLLFQMEMKVKAAEAMVVQELGGRRGATLRDTLKEKDIHLILLLDDLGVLDQSKKSADFLLWLKNVLSLHVQLVVSNEESLKGSFAQLSKQHEILSQQISIEMELKPFSREEARAFVVTKLKGKGLKVDQFEQQLSESISPAEVENSCWKRYEELSRNQSR